MMIIPAYAAVFACLFLLLSIRTIRARRSAKVAIGTGGLPFKGRLCKSSQVSR